MSTFGWILFLFLHNPFSYCWLPTVFSPSPPTSSPALNWWSRLSDPPLGILPISRHTKITKIQIPNPTIPCTRIKIILLLSIFPSPLKVPSSQIPSPCEDEKSTTFCHFLFICYFCPLPTEDCRLSPFPLLPKSQSPIVPNSHPERRRGIDYPLFVFCHLLFLLTAYCFLPVSPSPSLTVPNFPLSPSPFSINFFYC